MTDHTLFADYRAIRAVNWSSLKHLRPPDGSPKHYRHATTVPHLDSKPMRLGRAVHALLPDREEFEREWAVYDGEARRGTGWTAFEELNRGKELLTAPEAETAEAMAAAILDDEFAGPHMRGDGQDELTLTWRCRETGLDCKARLDRVTKRLLEVKSTSDRNVNLFLAAAERKGYHGQAGFYSEALEENGIAVTEAPLFIVVQSFAPFDVWTLPMDWRTVQEGRDESLELRKLLAKCIESDRWPGIAGNEAIPYRRPGWADADNEDFEITLDGEPLEV